MADRLDVVAIRVADERAVVVGVVVRPDPRLVEDFRAVFSSGVHAIFTPTTPTPAFPIGAISDPYEMYLNDIFTVTVNMAGLPGIAVPAGKDAQGLPLGLQLIGRPFDEETLFSLGEVIEQAAGRFTPAKWW